MALDPQAPVLSSVMNATVPRADPEEFLAKCRSPSFLKDIENQIHSISQQEHGHVAPDATQSSIAKIPAANVEASLARVDHEIAQTEAKMDLLNQMWVLRNALTEVEQLVELNELAASLDSLEVLQNKLRAAAHNPKINIVLLRDLEFKYKKARHTIFDKVSASWVKDVIFERTTEKFSVRISASFSENWPLYKRLDDNLCLVGSFVEQFGTFVDLFTSLKVSDIEETDDCISAVIGSVSSGESLVQNVQTFLFALTALVPPELYRTVADEYGNQMAEQLETSFLRLAPSRLDEFSAFKDEIQGVRGLQECMFSVGWVNSQTLEDFVKNIAQLWLAEMKGPYLGRLCTVLLGKYTPADSWDWNEDWDEDEEEEPAPEQASSDQPEKLSDIIREFAVRYEASVDDFLMIYLVLAPGYYKDNIHLYNETRRMLAGIQDLSCTNFASESLRLFVASTLESIVKKYLAAIDKCMAHKLDAATASSILKEVQSINTSIAPMDEPTRRHILVSVLEQVAVTTLDSTLAMSDITEHDGTNIALFIKRLSDLKKLPLDLENQVPSWIKMERLRLVLDQDLDGIRSMLVNNMLVDFSSYELVNLVEAIFVDSDKREILIHDIGWKN